ncbi:ATP-grasp domain-containing protein [uncultured Helcococcus sp.]|uniref:ATP-grasp domain-containing protein n=1 Tax=uncultured Helcococcus sp. TaxID=1072508 RepID=UPI00288A09B3|nr:ATP-grasp domain-containing protein [uncultured Helcococcus sp.]
MKRKILILGGGQSQVDLAIEAKKKDLEVYVIGGNLVDDIKQHTDHFEKIDIRDKDKVKSYVINNNIDFIFTMGLETALPIITEISEKLNLPNFFSSQSLEKFNDKYKWRRELGDIEGNLKSQSAKKLEDLETWDIYPAFLKPVDGSGQRGVYRVENFDDVKKVFDKSIKFSKSGTLIIEEYAGGYEISVNSFMVDNELVNYIISDRISYTEYPGGIIKEHIIKPHIVSDELDEKIRKLVLAVNQKMGFENGHIYFQMKIDGDKVNLIEFTPRYDGCHMWKLINYATDINFVQMSLDFLLGNKPEIKENIIKDGVFITKFISDKPHIIVDRSKYELPSDYLALHWYYKDGDKVKSVTGYMEKIGYYMIREDIPSKE